MSVTRLMSSEEIATNREKWLSLRKEGIGGSDAGAILGVCPWKTAFELWLEKTKQAEPADEEKADVQELAEESSVTESEVMYWGNRLEALVAEEFEKRSGKKVHKVGMVRSNEYPFMFADVDRKVDGENAILECKTTASWNREKWDEDKIPDSYYCQVQHYMAVGGYDRCYVVCLIGGNKFVMKTVERNQEDIDYLIKAEQEFWEKYVVTKKLPPADNNPDYKKAFAQQYPGGQKEEIEMPDDVEKLCIERLHLMETISPLEKKKEEIENKIRELMGNNEIACGKHFRISFRTKSYQRVNMEAFQKADKELYEKCLVPVISRRLFIMNRKGQYAYKEE